MLSMSTVLKTPAGLLQSKERSIRPRPLLYSLRIVGQHLGHLEDVSVSPQSHGNPRGRVGYARSDGTGLVDG